jgi:hypothetical protein
MRSLLCRAIPLLFVLIAPARAAADGAAGLCSDDPEPPGSEDARFLRQFAKVKVAIERDDRRKSRPIIRLDFGGEKRSPEVVKQVATLRHLQRLDLAQTGLKGADLEPLRGMHSLRYLRLCINDVGDEGMRHVGTLTGLRELDLCSAKITDQGMRHLAGLKSLTVLDLTKNKVTDAGLKHLYGLKGLKKIDLSGNDVTDTGVEALRARLPKLEVER